MVHISRTKKGNFIVANVAKNGELLKASEPLESKQSCWKNIRAENSDCYSGSVVFVQDNTGKVPKVWIVGEKKVLSAMNPETPYKQK